VADYEINEFGEIVFNNGVRKQTTDPLWEEYARLEYEVLNNHHNPTKDPIKIARYNELKKILDIKKSENALNKAKEEIKRRIIESDKSPNNSVIYTAMSNFKKTNE
jgi:hypothetical protein